MATVTETVLSINAGNSAETLKELRAEAKLYREQMNSAKVSSDEFNEAQGKLNNTLNQIKNVLSLGTKEINEADGSYNALVRTMSQLTQAWRATGDEATRAKLGEKILEINTRLKELDASRGNFQRNVGNYSSVFQGLSTSMSQVIRELPSLQMGMSTFVLAISNNLPILFDNIQRVNQELAEMRSQGQQVPSTIGAVINSLKSWNAILMVVTLAVQLLVSNWDKISALWRDKTPEELASEAIEEMNAALERQQDLLKEQNTENLRKYTEALREVGGSADKAREALEKFNEANRQNELAAATKKLEEAYKAAAQAYKAYVTAASGSRLFGVNEKEVEAALEALNEARSAVTAAKNEVAQAENDIAKAESDRAIQATEIAQKAEEEHQKELARKAEIEEAIQAIYDKQASEFERYAREHNYIPIPDFSEAEDAYDEYLDRLVEATDKYLRKVKQQKEKEKELEEKAQKAKKLMILDATAEMFGNLASLFEENTAAYKAFAIAEATIATYSAAVKSFDQLKGWPWGLIGIVSSIAAGMAQVKNIMSVDTSGKNTSVSVQQGPAIVNAPAVVQEVPITRTMLESGQEERLNSNIKDQRVYVVFSDIENAGKRVNVQREESSF